MSDYPELFSALEFGSRRLRNRIVCPPMVQCRPLTSAEGVAWYRRLAAGGAGLVIVEATGVPGFGQELTVETLTPLVEAIHAEGAAAAIQLFPIRFGTEADPNNLSVGKVDVIVELYGRAARICKEAGFDGVEPHGAHGYLINQFFKPHNNQRTDEYGGSLENRCRFGLQIVERIKAEIGDDLLIFYRHTPVGEAYSMDDSLVMAKSLIAAGVDVLDISPAMGEVTAELAAPFKTFGVPVIAVGGMDDPVAANEALAAGRCDLVAVGRQLLAGADWPNQLAAGTPEAATQCVKCNKCFEYLPK